jgi:Ca2+-binding RTX toxin-like protein
MATLRFIDQNSARLAMQLESAPGLRLFDALDLANVDRGDAGANRMLGTAITDHLIGLAGRDTLEGFAGDDTSGR